MELGELKFITECLSVDINFSIVVWKLNFNKEIPSCSPTIASIQTWPVLVKEAATPISHWDDVMRPSLRLAMPIWQNNIISKIFLMSYLLTPYQIENILNSIINPINGHSTLLVCLMSQNWQGNGDKLNMVGILELPVYRKCFNIHASLHVHVRWATVTCWMRTHIQRPKRSRLPTYPNVWVEPKPRSKYIAWNIITIIII